MAANHSEGRRLDLNARGIGEDVLITSDNGGILLESDTLRLIANQISKVTKVKLQRSDVDTLIHFIQELPPQQFYGKPLKQGSMAIARMFTQRFRAQNAAIPRDTGGRSDLDQIAELSGMESNGTISDYMQREITQTTDDENQYKWTAHAERRGVAVIDRPAQQGVRSTPNSIASGAGTGASSENDSSMRDLSHILKRFIDPANIDDLFKRARSSLTTGLQTYEGITFPRREIPFDSRNRDPSDTTPNGIKWYLHSAGRPGHPGDIHIQDTLQQVIRMKISPFWLPVSNPQDEFYSTVQMYIHEFFQRADVTEFLESDQSIPTVYGYQFRFKIHRRDKGRIYLVPEQDEYTFSKPVAQVDTITVSFRGPFAPIVFDSDRGIYTVTYGFPTLFTLTSGSNHNLITGDLVYSLNVADALGRLNSEVNTQRGLIITRINNTQFTVEVDTTPSGAGTQQGVNVFYGSKRIFFQIEFTSLEH